MQTASIRQRFLRFFKANGHEIVPSSPIVPAGDPTLLFTAAGMVQFKDVFLGNEPRSYQRAVSVQKCMRAGGKHNDLDQVGRTERHQTFFEMLGNFSFGDYFKADAIRYAWAFLTEELQISPDVLWVTVHESDDEAEGLWQEIAGVTPDRIVRLGEDNFWTMGDTGPCGPSSEIFVDRGEQYSCGPMCGLGQCDCERFREVWNLVFMQYDRDPSGHLNPLPRPSIDTGMGLERIAAYLQGVDSNFDTDVLFPLIQAVEKLSSRTYNRGPEGMPFRVIADHVRAMTFLLAEGVSFSNEGRGYVMRRILRRAMRYGMELGLDGAFLSRLVPDVVRIMGDAYPELVRGQERIQELISLEEERFLMTLVSGMRVLDQKLLGREAGGVLSGEDAFQLYDTFGFPLDLTRDAALERGLTVDERTFDALMNDQRERARRNRTHIADLLPLMAVSEFVGYDTLTLHDQPIVAIVSGGDTLQRVEMNDEAWLYATRTPFYPEGGGQVGDLGTITTRSGQFVIEDTIKVSGAIWHWGRVVSGYIVQGEPGEWSVNQKTRAGAMRNHTGTHLLHAALRQVLGEVVHQTGSLVSPDRLRFDFSYGQALGEEQIGEIEHLVNSWILADMDVEVTHTSKERALSEGALAFFDDKYGETVRVVTVAGASQELCGGTHCQRTGQIGLFTIENESSIGGGSRRIEATTGFNSLTRGQERRRTMQQLGQYFGSLEVSEWPKRIEEWQVRLKQYAAHEEESARTRRTTMGRQLESQAQNRGELRFVITEVEAESSEALREVLDGLKESVDMAVLASRHSDRASVVVFLGEGVRRHGYTAKGLVKTLGQVIGGGGGGRDDLAQAGGRDPNAIPELLQTAQEWVDKNFGTAG